MKPKILFIMHMPPPIHGAAMMGKYIHESKLINETFNCIYINPSASTEISNVGKISIKKIFIVISNILTIIRTVIKEKPDLCYYTSTIGGWGIFRDMLVVGSLKLLGQKIVLHLHNKGASTFYNKHKISSIAYHTIFRKVSIILLAKQLYSDISQFAKEKQIYYCPNGIPQTLTKPIIRENTHNPFTFLFLSNMIESKGVLILLKSCQLLKEKGFNFRCDFVGKWSDVTYTKFNNLIAQFNLQKNVFAHGAKYGNEKNEFLRIADALVFPTYFPGETFGLVLLEAMEYSLPCISTYEGGIPSIIENEKSGLLVHSQNVEELTKAMIKFIESPQLCIQMGKYGRNKFIKHYTLQIFENRITDILTDILNDSNAINSN